MRRTLAACLAIAVALSGCATPTSPRPVPFSEYQPPASPFKDVTLALMLSENTKQTIAYGQRTEKFAVSDGDKKFTVKAVVDDVVDMFKRDFKHVVRAESLRDGVAAGADLVAVFDWREPPVGKRDPKTQRYWWTILIGLGPFIALYSFIRNPIEWTTDYGVVFLDAQGRTVDNTRVVSKYYTRGHKAGRNFQDAFRYALYDLEKALVSAEGLQAWNDRRKTPSAAEAAAAPAPVRADFDLPDYKLPVDEDRYAVVVGVERYQHVDAAPYADADALAMKAHLLALGYPQRNIVLLSGERAGRAGIEKSVEAWLPERVTTKSKVLFYFAGHGSPDPEAGDGYLLPHDGDPKFLSNTGYPLSRLYEKLDGLKAAQVVAMLDAGFSGAGGRSVLPKGVRPLVNLKAPAAPKRLVVLEAAGESELAGVDPQTGHGLLTGQFLRTLKARKGQAPLGELCDEAAKAVADLARRENREQKPRLSAGRGLRL